MSDYLFDNFSELKCKINDAESIVLFLDYDGTLVGFRDNPMDAVPTDRTLGFLKKLIKKPKIYPIIITGRDPEHIKSLLPLKGLKFICIHGFIMDFADIHLVIDREEKQILAKIFDNVSKEFQGSDFDIERSDIGMSFNYRRCKKDEGELKRKFINMMEKYDTGKKFRTMYLSKCINIIPKNWDKGKAINFVLEKHFPGSLPVYFGDDTTDEDAFKALKNRGITVYVRNADKRGTEAQFFVKDPDEVLKALEKMFNKEIQTNN